MDSRYIPFTRMSALMPFIRFLREIGAPYERYLERVKIPIDWVGRLEQPVPLLSCYQFIEMSSQKEGEEHIALIAADYTNLDDLGDYGKSLLQSKTVYQYLMAGIKLFNTHTTGERFWLEYSGESVHFCHATFPHISKQQQLTTLYSLGVTINTLRQVFGLDWSPVSIGLPVLPAQTICWNSLEHTEIIRSHDYGFISIPEKLLCQPFTVPSVLENIANSEPEKLETGMVESTIQLIQMMLPHGYPDIDQVVDCTGLSKRTLQRLLKENQVSYKGLVEYARMEMACDRLQNSDAHITELAYQLAYNDSSNFTRAFRRKTGVSPSTYRDSFQ